MNTLYHHVRVFLVIFGLMQYKLSNSVSHKLCPISCYDLFKPKGQGFWDTLIYYIKLDILVII